MHWILQENIFDEDGYRSLLETLERFDIPHSLHKVIPFVGDLLPDIDPSGPVVCMGSYSMRHLAKERGWVPGVWDIAQQTFLVQRERWGDAMLNYDSNVVQFQEAVFPTGVDCMFIRPIDDTKVFAGKVFSRGDFVEWQRRVCVMNLQDNGSELASDTLVQMCVPKEIYTEHRFWVVAGEIVTSSLYKAGDTIRYATGAPEFLVKFVEDRVGEWEPHDAFVIDAADTPAGPKVVEINTINSSGYYAADTQRLVMAIEDAYG